MPATAAAQQCGEFTTGYSFASASSSAAAAIVVVVAAAFVKEFPSSTKAAALKLFNCL